MTNGHVTIEDVDPTEVRQTVDHLARRFLGMTGEQFLAHKANGSIYGWDDTPALMRVLSAASLLD